MTEQPLPIQIPIKDDAATGQRSLDVLTILGDAFDNLTEAGTVTVHSETSHVFLSVFGWWAWITRSSRLVGLAHRAGLAHETSPTVRSIMEHTLVLQWVVDVGDDALAALAERGDDNRRNLVRHATTAGWDLPYDVEVSAQPATAHPLKGMLNFANLCTAYNAKTLYVPYVLESLRIHPSEQGAAAYLDPAGTLSSTAVHETYGPIIHTATCLIQAARTVNKLIAGHPLDTAIARAEARTPEGRWASGPSMRSANKVSMIACWRWVMSASVTGSVL